MTKNDAISMFESPRKLAEALGITPQAVYQWPDDLSQDQADRILGAAIRLGRNVEKITTKKVFRAAR